MNSDEFYAAALGAAKTADTIMPGAAPAQVMIETVDGDLFEIDQVYFSVVSDGQIRIKALAYDDEFDEADVSEPDPDVEL